ncbi:MAG: hypothetical protein K9G76_05490 [Bacteroidales bacterium]|nr:hypothetical protein [Bacteroidales bacterium]MCF8403133.1 hypothetical protein [Bacteroidales bacterium]
MNPNIGRRSLYNKEQPKRVSKAVEYIHRNTKKSITLKQEYLYLEDVKTALNIHHLETNIIIKRWLLKQLNQKTSNETFLKVLGESIEKDRHILQKTYKISL